MKHILFYLTLVKAMLGVAISRHSAEPLDMAILLPRPVTAKPCEPLDLRILAAPIESRPVEALDLSILSDAPKPKGVAKSAVKPSIELGKEVRGQSRPLATIQFDYPTRSSNWTYPGQSREQLMDHLLNADHHRGKYTKYVLSRMATSELLALHSDDHEHREKPLTLAMAPPTRESAVNRLVESVTAPAFTPDPKPLMIEGRWYWQHRDKTYWDHPEQGVKYDGMVAPVASAPRPMKSRSRQTRVSNCPGGACPTR